MKINLNFFGAAQNVTGSCYLLEINGYRLMVDCGFYQERKLKDRNWDEFPVPPSSINAVLLTHAHLDHCGRLPKLAREGFDGDIICTKATADIARIVLLDSAKIQEEDAKYKRKRHAREGRTGPHPVVPLYTVEDAEKCLPQFKPVDYERPASLSDGIEASFHDAGHILGSSMIKLSIDLNGEKRTILFSGDVGRWDVPIICDPTLFDEADYVLCESTYGNRKHKPEQLIPEKLARVINTTAKAGGNIVVPSFAVERTQELLYHLSGLLNEKLIPRIPVFVDSPMAVRVTEVFKRHLYLFDEDARELIRQGKHPCDFQDLQMSRTVDESKAIQAHGGSAVIIAGSGMCTGGRIKHHLKHNIEREESTLMFVGYQAAGTLGRILLEGKESVRIHGQRYQVRANVTKINGFSAHADRDELFKWLSALKRPPRRLFVTHGEIEAASDFADYVKEKTGWPVTVAEYKVPVELD